jgi:glycosyltransferase involved in cell wall biosynthesis
VDIESDTFRDLLNSCVGHVYPSASEGASTALVDTMHAGLIPIASYESGVDIQDFGLLLKTSTIDDIQETVKTIADLPASELERRARKAWEYARANHTRERFTEEYRNTIKTILNTYGK